MSDDPASRDTDPRDTDPRDTAVIPGTEVTREIPPVEQGDTQVLEPLAGEPVVPPKKRRRRVILLAWIIGVVVVLVAGFFIAEQVVRSYATGYVRDQIVKTLSLSADDTVGVDLGGGLLIPQLIARNLDTVRIAVPDLTVGSINGSASVVAHDIPLDQDQPVKELALRFSVDEEGLNSLLATAAGTDVPVTATLGDGQVTATAEISVFALKFPIAVSFTPGATNGELVLTPSSITLNGAKTTADEFRNGLFGSLATPLLAPRTFCVASELPSDLVLEGVRVTDKRLVIAINGDGATLGGEGLTTKGTCPA
ncbi:LmeA family phospholipid-binding protein [Glaciihabitans sp. dw_435]|uniref:LmeA family phospholipid-binding protein n=1 Tax=Glaciihabitans sp. dw_435 TaxID=2720081 RepID=UPI001BD5DFAA|nr:LmeA family phospholipid-binding protein [Glaciihabitans sp. dw_435]